MPKMYSNLAKTYALPVVFRVSSKPRYYKQFHTLKSQSLPIVSFPKLLLNPKCMYFTKVPLEFEYKRQIFFNFVKPEKIVTVVQCKSREMGNTASGGFISSGCRLRNGVQCYTMLRARSFSSSFSHGVGEGNNAARDGKPLPWLSSRKVRDSGKRIEKVAISSSWEETAKRLEKRAVAETGSSSCEDSAKRLEKGVVLKSDRSSWNAFKENSKYIARNKENRNRLLGSLEDSDCGNVSNKNKGSVIEKEKEGEEEEELDVADDTRWDKIKNKFKGMTDMNGRIEKSEFQRWNKQENWGRKTWREATESNIPKMVGEGVYGVGPVLAALSAGRREFYSLYVQEGLDLSSNNKKKKDKKGFEKVLRMAQKIGLSIREISKHDLNMVVDNRPHQGLVLDASPLEMVKIMELDPVSTEDDKGSLWIALDEVTDPQNLGAIIRSAYFFGASGVVLCAKNSAPLSGVVSKASAGSLEIMELRYCKNMMQFLVSSAENGWRVLGGSVSSKAVPLNEVLPGEPTILVLGSEGTGLRPLVERSCTQLVQIPGNIPMDVTVEGNDDSESEKTNIQRSNEEFRSFLAVESLNVSVAAGVLLHHLIGRQ